MRNLVDELRGRQGDGPAVDLLRAMCDQDELDELCGHDEPLPPAVNAAPLTARELVTSPQPVGALPEPS